MEQAEIERHLKGVIIAGQKYNPLIADAFEHMKSNSDLVAFLQDEDVAYQAYLALRDTLWRLNDGQELMFGWQNCSSLVALLRGKGEHPQLVWSRFWSKDAPSFAPAVVARFDELIARSGWTVKHREPPIEVAMA
jgi:hypothetical protein